MTNTAIKRVLRGGAWWDDPRVARVANRIWDAPGDRFGIVGFRLVYREPLVDDRRVLRGGSWGSRPGNLRSAFRFRGSADAWFDFIGFRLVYRGR